MPSRVIQTNFTAGEISPRVFGRVDLEKYPNALAELENMTVMVQGPVVRRAGSYFIASAKFLETEIGG